jgi:hypothetical protein
MKVIKPGNRRLFENDPETSATVSRMLLELERDGMDAVRRYSQKFDDWNPRMFQLTGAEISEAIAQVPEQAIRDTEYCQENVRRFAQAQLARPGICPNRRFCSKAVPNLGDDEVRAARRLSKCFQPCPTRYADLDIRRKRIRRNPQSCRRTAERATGTEV